MPSTRLTTACVLLLSAAVLAQQGPLPSLEPRPSSPQDLPSSPEPRISSRLSPESEAFFTMTRVHTAHLAFTADQWAAMQPTGAGGFGGGFGGGTFLGAEGARNGVAARAGVEFNYAHATLDLDGTRFADVAARYKGNGSYMSGRAAGKISIKVDLNKYAPKQQLAGATTLNFQNNITDIGWMNEVLAYRLYRDAGALAPRTAYARVYVTVAGQFEHRYFGLYSISENVDTHFMKERFGSEAGIIVKPSTRAPFTTIGDTWVAYNQTYDPKTDLSDADKQRIMQFAKLVSTASDADFAAHIAEYLDVDQFGRYLATLVWIANPDSLLSIGQNYYVYMHPASRKFMFVAWDQDWSLGPRSSTSWAVFYPWNGVNPFLGRVYDVPAFREAYLARMKEFSNTIFKPERFAGQIAQIAPAIRPAIEEEGTQWLRDFDTIASGQSGIMPFVRARAAFVNGELAK
jgi:spore coat protein H